MATHARQDPDALRGPLMSAHECSGCSSGTGTDGATQMHREGYDIADARHCPDCGDGQQANVDRKGAPGENGTRRLASVSPSPMSGPRLPRNRSTYQHTAVALMRNAVLDAMQRMLLKQKWTSITMADVAAAAGISRGTLYNEFRSRNGLARNYALRLTDAIIIGMENAIEAHPGDGYHTLHSTFTAFFDYVDNDPLVQVLRNENAPNDLLRMITVESQFILDYATKQLTDLFQESWMRASQADAELMARAIARTALSFLALPPDESDDAATGIARVFAPCIEAMQAAS